MSGGDNIKDLPINNDQTAKPGDLEIIYNLFQSGGKAKLAQLSTALTPFKTIFIGTVLFGLLSLPFVLKFVETYCKNPIFSRLLLMLAFLVIFFLLSKI